MEMSETNPSGAADFKMVAKTLQGLEDILAEELRALGARNVEPGRRMVSFEGDLEMMYRANLSLRTALRVLKPLWTFEAGNPDELYDRVKELDWSKVLTPEKTFALDTVVNSDEFSHSLYVTYRVKDAIVDYFQDRLGEGVRPGVRLKDADVMINVHISGRDVTLSLDSSGESLHKRGYRVASTEAPINEVLAAGIILRSGWRGDCPLVDPMCGSGTFLIEAALIGANIMPGIYRRGFAFENWPDFDRELFESIYNDDSGEREPAHKIYGADISPKAVAIAERNIKSAGVARYVSLQRRPLSQWEEAPEGGMPGIMVTNPPYGERISVDDMGGLYQQLGMKLKNVFKGYHAWVIGYREEYFNKIGLAPSVKLPVLNGALECELREYVIFEGDYDSFRAAGGTLHTDASEQKAEKERQKIEKNREKRAREERRGGGNRQKGGFGRRRGDEKRGDDSRRGRWDNKQPRPRREEAEDENPLAARRNPHALKDILGRRPTLPKGDGPIMRPRRGWRRPDADNGGGDNSGDGGNKE